MKAIDLHAKLVSAILVKVGFKGDEMRRFQAAAIYAALELYPMPFAADDIPSELRPQSMTTSGCCFATLRSNAVRVFEPCGRRTSRSDGRNGARINEYTVRYAEALRWLEANGFDAPKTARDVKQGQNLLFA